MNIRRKPARFILLIRSHFLLTSSGTNDVTMTKTLTRRTHVVIPAKVVSEIDARVGKRQRSRFIVQAAERELRRLAQARALEAATGAWRVEDHPELRKSAAAWVRKLRSEGERRIETATRRNR